ncbi:hypothetical protein BO85DRAFT_55674 [Aspergillus piperis CBS 112811]|uniref:Uncharacterized protein n=1 Tax=Aspergillus piperis CBS 112811 TaxID=1448313 RepID=A0A8G1VKS5_9EURO|nr:hypothetical protein BO85DRAFT_55674 [Aspergillus piperis CBS 112811]RAH56000.1 hypothetical protein BO85DRAFT_55674 [Aspergillus piperis CBS 112811]
MHKLDRDHLPSRPAECSFAHHLSSSSLPLVEVNTSKEGRRHSIPVQTSVSRLDQNCRVCDRGVRDQILLGGVHEELQRREVEKTCIMECSLLQKLITSRIAFIFIFLLCSSFTTQQTNGRPHYFLPRPQPSGIPGPNLAPEQQSRSARR